MNNPVPFLVILDDPQCTDPDQMAEVIAARLQGDARLALVTPVRRCEDERGIPAGSLVAQT